MRYLLETGGRKWWVEDDSLKAAIQQLDGFEDAAYFEKPGGAGGSLIRCYEHAPLPSGADWSYIGNVRDLTAVAHLVALPPA